MGLRRANAVTTLAAVPAATWTADQPAPWCTRREAGRLLGISERSVGRLCASGKLRERRVLGRVFVWLWSVEEYVNRG